MRPDTPEIVAARAAYIQKWDGHLDLYFSHRVDVRDKRLLIVGSGWGSEVLWALKRGARDIVGIDPSVDDRRPLDVALAEAGLAHLADRVVLRRATTLSMGDAGAFDVVLSNNVAEHVFGLSANLAALADLMPDKGARFALFAAPLFYSSLGHHLPIGPWEHLTLSQDVVRSKVGPFQWNDYRSGLNGMSITDFLAAVREAGMLLLEMSLYPDTNLSSLAATLPSLPPGIKPMDLALEGIGCTLAFPHNL